MPKKITEAEIATSLHTLRAMPPYLARLVEDVAEPLLWRSPAPDEWSLVEIMAHLRAAAAVWSYSIYAMLALDAPQLADIHPRQWTKTHRYGDLSYADNLAVFTMQRASLLDVLDTLRLDEWGRTATFTSKVNTHTIFSQTRRMALHETSHQAQLEATLAAAQSTSL